jgi:hypothetical protein
MGEQVQFYSRRHRATAAKAAAIALAATFASSTAQADQYADVMQNYARENVLAMATSPVIIDAIRQQNQTTAAYAQPQIDALDRAWRDEVGRAERPTIDPVLGNAVSNFLRQQVAASGGVMTEAFAMDSVGLNVGTSSVTSDYWQGDEAKHAETYGAGPGAVHIGDIEFDDSTQSYQGQVSVAVVDPGTGSVIGALTVGLNAEMLF